MTFPLPNIIISLNICDIMVSLKSYQVLEADMGFQAMKIAQEVLPDDKVKPSWHEKAVKEMLEMNILKYSSCAHVKKALMCSKVVLAEAMSNAFWGLGLPPDITEYFV